MTSLLYRSMSIPPIFLIPSVNSSMRMNNSGIIRILILRLFVLILNITFLLLIPHFLMGLLLRISSTRIILLIR